ncbi:hypothetical protein [Vulcanococcus sp.]|jgi:hypothetical protein|uniref:hypothetical protein n=1 Tax=Vulcanococcus sp. TaxID=2856995 RepID=UPI0037D99AB3
MHKSVERDLITCGEAAGILGITLQAVHQGLRKGIVRHELVNGRKMLDPHRLVQRWRGVSDQEARVQRLNSYLGDKWPAPPYTADQWQTLRVVLEMAGD